MASLESNTQCQDKGTDEKEKIRKWQRKHEIHPLVFYESFSLDDIFDENGSTYDIGGLTVEFLNLEDNSQRNPGTVTRERSAGTINNKTYL